MAIPNYDLELNLMDEITTPGSSRLIQNENSKELVKYINLIRAYLVELSQTSGVDLDNLMDAFYPMFTKVVLLQSGMSDNSAITDTITGLIIARAGNKYTINIENGHEKIVQVTNKLNNKVIIVDIEKTQNEIIITFDTAITNDFTVVIK